MTEERTTTFVSWQIPNDKNVFSRTYQIFVGVAMNNVVGFQDVLDRRRLLLLRSFLLDGADDVFDSVVVVVRVGKWIWFVCPIHRDTEQRADESGFSNI